MELSMLARERFVRDIVNVHGPFQVLRVSFLTGFPLSDSWKLRFDFVRTPDSTTEVIETQKKKSLLGGHTANW